jgi:hypothetical protein
MRLLMLVYQPLFFIDDYNDPPTHCKLRCLVFWRSFFLVDALTKSRGRFNNSVNK